MDRKKKIFIYGAIVSAGIGSVSKLISDIKFKKKMKREIADVKVFQNMEHDFLTRHSLSNQEELEEIRNEIGSVYEHLAEMQNIKNYGR